MPTSKFEIQASSTHPRIFAVTDRGLQAIATLQNATDKMLDQIVERMNVALATGDTKPIQEASAGLSEQVRLALTNAIPPLPHDWWPAADLWGRKHRADEGRTHNIGDEELADLLDGVDVLDSGLRAVNYRGRFASDDAPDVVFGWAAHVRLYPGTCFSDDVNERAWPLPEGVTPVVSIQPAVEDVAEEALELQALGHLVRISTALVGADWDDDYFGGLCFFLDAFTLPLPTILEARAQVERYANTGW